MNSKVIAIIIIIVLVAAGIYFGTKPVTKGAPPQPQEQQAQPAPAEKGATTQPSSAEKAYQAFLDWKKDASPTTAALDERLKELAAQFPADYRFSLERIRGAANIKGVLSHSQEFETLEDAARKAIACQCGDAERMRNDLLANKNEKSHGFWKLSTHPKQWNVVVVALEHEDAGMLEKSGEQLH